MLLVEIVKSINFHRPKPDQMAQNRPEMFMFKINDVVTHKEYPGMYGIIIQPLFFHETDMIGYIPSQNTINGYQEYLDAIEEGGDDPYSQWYKIKWTNATELADEHGTDIGLESEDSLTKISNKTNNLTRMKRR